VSEQPPTRLHRVSLIADERTVPGGTATTSWRFFDGTIWCSIKDHPRATFTRLDCGPGLLWRTQAEILVAAECWLMRVERAPDRRNQPTDPLDYLRRQVRLRRYAIQHTFFKVAARGGLRRVPREQAPLGADALD
jgi:hypothetical protein